MVLGAFHRSLVSQVNHTNDAFTFSSDSLAYLIIARHPSAEEKAANATQGNLAFRALSFLRGERGKKT